MPIVDDTEIRHDRAEFAERQGEHWKNVHAEAFSKLPVGTTVIIDVVSGEYVTGQEWFKTLAAYEQKFGRGRTISWTFEIGRPLFVGGGLWRS
jgi:hypothetical protein